MKFLKYKGPNKHTQEELEDIIDSMLECIYEQDTPKSTIQTQLEELVREIYQSCKIKKKNITVKTLKMYLEDFAEQNNFNLNDFNRK